ncbi:MAG: hypothetical protein J6V90_06330 [Treponema sp.]|nr:hypothetical protein [Treponema sp.]
MKKLGFVFAALLALTLVSCITFKSSFQNNDDIKIGGRLQVNDNKSYFIIVGDEEGAAKYAQTFFLIKDKQNPEAWKELVSCVGKVVFVHGTVVQTHSEWVKTVAVNKVSLP